VPDYSTNATRFGPDDVIDITWVPNSTYFVIRIALADNAVGRAVVHRPEGAKASRDRVVKALNFQVEGFGYDAVVEQLKDDDGLLIDPTLF
jgi:hypothetical protein